MEKKSKDSYLDKNHSHFILVKNNENPGRGGEIEFRSKLEESFSNEESSENSN